MPLSLRHAQGKTCSVVQSGTNFALGQPDCPISSGITWDCWNLWRFGEITNKNLQHFKTCHPLATEWKTYSSFSSFPHHQNQLETWKSCFSGRFVHVCPFLPWFTHNYMFSITNLTSKLISPRKKQKEYPPKKKQLTHLPQVRNSHFLKMMVFRPSLLRWVPWICIRSPAGG